MHTFYEYYTSFANFVVLFYCLTTGSRLISLRALLIYKRFFVLIVIIYLVWQLAKQLATNVDSDHGDQYCITCAIPSLGILKNVPEMKSYPWSFTGEIIFELFYIVL